MFIDIRKYFFKHFWLTINLKFAFIKFVLVLSHSKKDADLITQLTEEQSQKNKKVQIDTRTKVLRFLTYQAQFSCF